MSCCGDGIPYPYAGAAVVLFDVLFGYGRQELELHLAAVAGEDMVWFWMGESREGSLWFVYVDGGCV